MDSPSDLLVDVARAADPQRATAMAQRLAALTGASDPQAFVDALADATPPAGTNAGPPIDTGASLATPAAVAPDRTAKARQQFEATLLSSFVGEMMPKEAGDAYGGGYAGDMWRSLLTEKVSEQIAKSGALHIADRLFDNGRSPALHRLGGPESASEADGAVTATSGNDLSLSVAKTVRDGAYLFGRDETL